MSKKISDIDLMKFVDGELASDRNNNQDMRRQRRSKEARGKRRAGRNK